MKKRDYINTVSKAAEALKASIHLISSYHLSQHNADKYSRILGILDNMNYEASQHHSLKIAPKRQCLTCSHFYLTPVCNRSCHIHGKIPFQSKDGVGVCCGDWSMADSYEIIEISLDG